MKERIVKCPKCHGTGKYSGRYDSGKATTACNWCFDGRISMKELNCRKKKVAEEIKKINEGSMT